MARETHRDRQAIDIRGLPFASTGPSDPVSPAVERRGIEQRIADLERDARLVARRLLPEANEAIAKLQVRADATDKATGELAATVQTLRDPDRFVFGGAPIRIGNVNINLGEPGVGTPFDDGADAETSKIDWKARAKADPITMERITSAVGEGLDALGERLGQLRRGSAPLDTRDLESDDEYRPRVREAFEREGKPGVPWPGGTMKVEVSTDGLTWVTGPALDELRTKLGDAQRENEELRNRVIELAEERKIIDMAHERGVQQYQARHPGASRLTRPDLVMWLLDRVSQLEQEREGQAEALAVADGDRVPLRMDLDEAQGKLDRIAPIIRALPDWAEMAGAPRPLPYEMPLHTAYKAWVIAEAAANEPRID